MTLAKIKSNNKCDALALLGNYLDSPEGLYASIQCVDGEYTVDIIRPSHTAYDVGTPLASGSLNLPESGPAGVSVLNGQNCIC